MNDQASFKPLYIRAAQQPTTQQGTLAPSVTVAATDASGVSAVFPGTAQYNGSQQIQIANLSSSWAYVNFGVFGNVAAAVVATHYPVAPGSVVVVTVAGEVTGAAVILGTAAATGNVIFTRGEGV